MGRGRTPTDLPAAIAPVIVGTAAAAAHRDLEQGTKGANLGLALLAMIVSCCLQVGVNYANDYSDGIRGTDEDRVGPVRLVGQRLAEPGNVKIAAFTFFGIGAFAGFALVALSQTWILIPVGVLAIIAAWRYTGGDNPYGYRGLGELYVFVFFGLVATLGTQYTQLNMITPVGVLGAVGVGALATAILVANNLRDIPTDSVTGKKTLAVRLGDARTRQLYVGLFGVAIVCTLLMAFWRRGRHRPPRPRHRLARHPGRPLRRDRQGTHPALGLTASPRSCGGLALRAARPLILCRGRAQPVVLVHLVVGSATVCSRTTSCARRVRRLPLRPSLCTTNLAFARV